MEHGAGVVVARSVGRLQGRKGLLWAVDIARQMFKAEPDRSTIVVPTHTPGIPPSGFAGTASVRCEPGFPHKPRERLGRAEAKPGGGNATVSRDPCLCRGLQWRI